jgi:hypothetical protein
MRQLLWSGWNFMRIFRLVLGLIILGQGIGGHDLLSTGMGIFLSLMAVLNTGCCGAYGCDTGSYNLYTKTDQKAIEYEEVSA